MIHPSTESIYLQPRSRNNDKFAPATVMVYCRLETHVEERKLISENETALVEYAN